MKIYHEEMIRKTNRHQKDQITTLIVNGFLSLLLIVLGIYMIVKTDYYFAALIFIVALYLIINGILGGVISGTGTPAELVESAKQLFQDEIDAILNP